MNEIDQILSNIDKDDDNLFQAPGSDAKLNEEISKLIDVLGAKIGKEEAPSEDQKPEESEADRGAAGQPEEAPADTEHYDHVRAAEAGEVSGFSMPGSKHWNRHEPYIITVNPDAYRNDVESLQKSFFFVEEPSSHDALKQIIKQEIVAFLRKPSGHVTERYADFICKKISVMVRELAESFKLDHEAEKLFMYHLGPLTVYKYLKDDFLQNKYGYCYQYMPGNKATRFFPDDFIKATVLKWFEENINTMNLPFDSIQKYEEMKKVATRKYYNDLRIFNTRLDQLNAKLGAEKSISRIKLFQIKGSQWFGHMNLEVYRRFIGGSIFM